MQPRVVAITGGSSGIGRAAAIRFAREGWRVGLIARGEAALEAACKDVVEHGGTAAMAIADVADPAQLEAAAASIEATLGPIEVWINNAGVSVWGWFEDVPEEQFRRVTEVNYLGTVNGTRVALRRMLPRDAGTIVQVVSVVSHRGVPLQAAYSGAKYGLRGFSEAVRSELHARRSRVYLTMVHPPSVNTPFYDHAASHMGQGVRPPPPVWQPEDVADALFRAATTRRREHKLGAQTHALALGNTLAPAAMDLLAGRLGVSLQLRGGGSRGDPDGNLVEPSPAGGVRGPFSRLGRLRTGRGRPGGEVFGLGLGLIALAWLAGAAGERV